MPQKKGRFPKSAKWSTAEKRKIFQNVEDNVLGGQSFVAPN